MARYKEQPKPFRRSEKGRYYFYVYEKGKRLRRSTGETTIPSAERAIRAYLKNRKRERPTFREFTENMFDPQESELIASRRAGGYRFSDANARNRYGHLKKYFWNAFGNDYLADPDGVPLITRQRVREYLASLKLQNQTRAHMVYTLSIIYEEAKDAGLVNDNPFRGAKLFSPSAGRKERNRITDDERKKLFPEDIRACQWIWGNLKNATFAVMADSCGFRNSEIARMKWEDVVYNTYVLVDQEKVEKRKMGFLHNRARALLSAWREKSFWTDPDDYIFWGTQSKRPLRYTHMDPATLTHWWEKAMERAEIKLEGRNLVFYSLRHTYYNTIRGVVPESVLQTLMGHTNPNTGDKNYYHPDPADLRAQIMPYEQVIDAKMKL